MFIGWNERGAGVDGLDVAAGDMPEQRAQRRGHGRRFERLRPCVRRGVEAEIRPMLADST